MRRPTLIVLFLTAFAALDGVECPGTWEPRTPPPFAGAALVASATLPDGRVLVVAERATPGFTSAVYDPAADTWSTGGELPTLPVPDLVEDTVNTLPDQVVLRLQQLVPLPDGRVIAVTAAGRYFVEVFGPDGSPTGVREESVTVALHWEDGAWLLGGVDDEARYRTAAIALDSDRVLVAGGINGRNGPVTGRALVYAATARTWTPSGGPFPLADDGVSEASRADMTLVRVPDGRVLATGGIGGDLVGGGPYGDTFLVTADGVWSPSGTLGVPRYGADGYLLADGRVLLLGGTDLGGDRAVAEAWSPGSGTWTRLADAPGAIPLTARLGENVLALAPGGDAFVIHATDGTWCTTSGIAQAELLAAQADGSVLAFAAGSTARFTLDDGDDGDGTLDITHVDWVIRVDADSVRVGGDAAVRDGGTWRATTTLPGARATPVVIDFRTGEVLRRATGEAAEADVPIGGG